MKYDEQVVYVVDDDASVRGAMRTLLSSVGIAVEDFGSAEEFLGEDRAGAAGCLILDVRMPQMGGLELLDELRSRAVELPIIFITGHGDVPTSVRAMKRGAVDFLLKPFNEQELLEAVHKALAADEEHRGQRKLRVEAQERLQQLTPRELQVLALVVAGHTNKEIGEALGAAENTIKIHRGRVMQKMKADSVPQLVRWAQLAGIEPGPR